MPKKKVVPSKAEVISALKSELDAYVPQAPNGVSDIDVAHRIRCLETALLMVRAYRPVKR